MDNREDEALMNQQWNTGIYDKDMSFVSQFGAPLIDLLQPQPGEQIMDWGCGTGDLAATIATSGALITGIDASAEMIQTARDKYPSLRFIVADGQSFVAEQPVDAIFSNAALHWMTDASGAAASIAASLRTGGRFVAEFGALGNIASIVTELPNAFVAIDCKDKLQLPWYFPTLGQYTTLLEKVGLTVDFAHCYDRPTPLVGGALGFQSWLNTFTSGILSVLTPSERENVLSYMEQTLKPALYKDGQWVMDYRRIRVVAYKRA